MVKRKHSRKHSTILVRRVNINMDIEKATKIIKYKIKKYKEELEIELEDKIDEPRIAYLLQQKSAIETVLSELEKKDEYIKMLTDEREHIKNNLKVDLKKGVFSQAKGQIAQILEYYENNEKYFDKVEKEGIKE